MNHIGLRPLYTASTGYRTRKVVDVVQCTIVHGCTVAKYNIMHIHSVLLALNRVHNRTSVCSAFEKSGMYKRKL